MRCSLAELYERVDSNELVLWLAHYSLEGWPEQRADDRAAMIAWVGAGGRGKLKDFIIDYDQDRKTDWRELKAYFMSKAEEAKHGR